MGVLDVYRSRCASVFCIFSIMPLKSLRSKLGERNRTHAVCRAIELGIAEETGLAMSYSPV